MSDQPKKRGRRAAGAADETEQQIPIVEAKAAEPAIEAAVADEHDVAAEAPIEVINLDGDLRRTSQTRIDSLLSALESEIRAMPPSEDERESAIAEVIHLIRESLTRWPKKVIEMAVNTLKANINSDYLDADFWKGIGLVLRYQLDANADMVKRRWRGDYAVDEFGLDYELLDLAKPLLLFMYKKYWRVEAVGLENVPDSGRALLVCNHSGVLPWDGAMVGAALNFEHEAGRVLRNLHLSWFSSLPFISPLLSRLGQVQALPANAEALLERDELVGVFPEGLKGVGKLYKDRYRLARFGRGGFVKVAVKTGAPIIPVSIIGGEEIHPHLHNAKGFAKLLGFPYFPITPTFPWFGPLGLIPLPTKWTIVFGEPIDTEQYGAKGAEDPLLISQLTEQVRTTIQNTLLDKLKDRSNIFV
ncbi:lysophospholipid acyltransferase family protein [Herpetosiphon giganteus]|uniref:lysophospholipid acyltransferase family protein n=1 Tax=Herpetosiphon giganteus TaxID=2029754 RepID=UPI00195A5688|nr:lysophospholipid acyltransferase family protein [Herpetosiphon giganteus]MBM7844887.1 1-acyl-sn-glycerol-3-phosphate acyltransferase [Herpetosiphon giganteus]